VKFLSKELSCVPDALAKRIVAELQWETNVQVDSLVDKQVLIILIVNKLA